MPRHFSDWLEGYIQYTKASESPLQFHFWTGISVIAGAMRGKVFRDEKTFRWTPNLYTILVGPPGVAQKSTSMKLGMNLLETIDGIHWGPSSATWQRLSQVMQTAGERVDFVNLDGSPGEFEISCVTLAISELGTFMKLAQEGFADVLIDMWDGQIQKRAWSHETVGSTSVSIANPWLNMIGCTTPSWLREHYPEEMIGGGLTSRIVFVYGEQKRHMVPYPSQIYQDGEFEELQQKLIEDLNYISVLKGPVELTREAIAWGSAWYTNLWAYRPPHLSSDKFDAYIARKQVFLHKLAIIRMGATGDRLVITPEHLIWADHVLTSAEKSMGKVLRTIGFVKEAGNTDALIRQIKRYQPVAMNDLWHFVRTSMEYSDFREALKSGVESGLITQVNVVNGGVTEPRLMLGEFAEFEDEG